MSIEPPFPHLTGQIELRSVASLTPYARNARTHSRSQVTKIAKSISTFGFVNPILIDGKGEIIAGHGRLEAAKLLGMAEVPVLPVIHMNAAQKRAYVLADNRIAEQAGWDREMLALEFQGLMDLDFDLDLTGFDLAEIDLILDEDRNRGPGPSTQEAADVVPVLPPGPATTRPGDIWQLGPHRLICGDARDAKTLDALLRNEEVDLVFTDPPYNVAIDGHVGGLGKVKLLIFTQN